MAYFTPYAFYLKHNGETNDFDHSHGPQCVDSFKLFCHEADLPVVATGNGWADGYWIYKNKHGFAKNFEYIYDPKDFRNGDWVIWKQGSKSHPKSHIAMYLDGKEFGQSGFTPPKKFTLKKTDFSDALGALRWKAWTWVDIFRLYNRSRHGMHHFTPSEPEKKALVKLGWKYEGIAWLAPKEGDPVYSMYNPNNGDHCLTANADECKKLTRLGLRNEGIKFYSGGDAQIWRIYNKNTGEHFYTANKGEYDHLVLLGWTGEGKAFKALKGD